MSIWANITTEYRYQTLAYSSEFDGTIDLIFLSVALSLDLNQKQRQIDTKMLETKTINRQW